MCVSLILKNAENKGMRELVITKPVMQRAPMRFPHHVISMTWCLSVSGLAHRIPNLLKLVSKWSPTDQGVDWKLAYLELQRIAFEARDSIPIPKTLSFEGKTSISEISWLTIIKINICVNFMFCAPQKLCTVLKSCFLLLTDFIHILQYHFPGTGAIIILPYCQWSYPFFHYFQVLPQRECAGLVVGSLSLWSLKVIHDGDGLVQDCGNSISNALELPESCAKPSNCYIHCIDGLLQNCSISIANALKILQSCTKPSLCAEYHLLTILKSVKLRLGYLACLLVFIT